MTNADYPEGIKERDIDRIGEPMDGEKTECKECGEALQMLLRCPYCTDMGKELREENKKLREALIEIIRVIKSSHKGSIGEIQNTYLPQINIDWLDSIEKTLDECGCDK